MVAGTAIHGELIYYAGVWAIGFGAAFWGNLALWARARADCIARDWGEDEGAKRRWLFWLFFLWPSAWIYYFQVMRASPVGNRQN